MQLHLFADFHPMVQVHILFAVAAFLLGPVALLRRSRDRVHKGAGYLWVLAMTGTAVSSFWIHGFTVVGPFGPIHLLSLYVLWGLWQGVRHARAGDIAAHRATMRGLYLGAMLGAGLFTLLPGRRMSAMLFPDAPWTGFAGAAVLVMAVLVAMQLRGRARFPLHNGGALR